MNDTPKVKIDIRKSELVKRKLMLGVPMYGGQCSGMFTRSVQDLAVTLQQWGVTMVVHYLFNESLITRARNYIADEFMRSDCTHLMFIDADIAFAPADVIAMLALSEEGSDYDVLAGVYPKKCISWEKIKRGVEKGYADENPENLSKLVGDFVFNPLPGQGEIQIYKPNQVLETGTGFMLIQRKAFEKIKAMRPDLLYRPDHIRTEHFDGSRDIMAYFMDPIDRHYPENDFRKALEDIMNGEADPVPEAKRVLADAEEKAKTMSRRLLSEDYFFCQELRKAGGKVWILPWIQLKHVGSYIFGGSLVDLAQVGASATADPEELRRASLKKRK